MTLGSYILHIVYFEEIILISNVFDEKCMKAVCKRKRSKLLSRSKLMSPTVVLIYIILTEIYYSNIVAEFGLSSEKLPVRIPFRSRRKEAMRTLSVVRHV